jgi:hypothetical protein
MTLDNSNFIRMVTSQHILALKRGCSRQRLRKKCSSMQCLKEDHVFNSTPPTPVGITLNLTIQEQSIVRLWAKLVLDMQSGLYYCQKLDGANSMR